ncbi:MAG: RNA polymerase sigma factor [Candidatus Dormibacteria bacterium]|jgi:RNA polymerase sigma-70 factor (ECF subfamily)
MDQVLEMAAVDDLELARQGDDGARTRVLEPLLDPGYRLAYGILRRREAAEDALQDACYNALRALTRFRGDQSRLRPWFLTIVANQCRSQLRRPFFSWLPIPETLPSGDFSGSVATSHDLGEAMQALGFQQQLILALFYYLDLPLDEVAAVIGIKEAAARSRLYRAVGELRRLLREPEGS